MKINLLLNLFIVIFLITFRSSQAQSIINSGFESWSNNSLSRLDVDGWLTSNTQYSAITVVQDVPYAGNHSAKMVSIFDAGAGSYVGGDMGTAEIYLTAHSQPGSLKGYFKQNILDLFDHIFVTVNIYDSLSNTIGTGTFNPPPLTNYPTFTLFNAPISYTSSANMWGYSIFISFFPSTQSNAVWAVVDNIYFDVASGIDVEDLDKLISVFPNPASNQIKVKVLDVEVQNIEVHNLLGEKITAQEIDASDFIKNGAIINVSEFPAGMYVIEARMEDRVIRKKFIKE